jgi:tetratricopeptide (TPR) repeat protein
VADSDIWWHLAAGREMVRTGGVLHQDPFSLSALGRPWIDVHWLFQLLGYAGFQLGGLRALVLGKAALVAAGAVALRAVVLRAAGAAAEADGVRRAGSALLLVLLPAALLAARHLLLVRPVILSLLFLAAFLYVLERYRAEGNPRLLLALPLAQVLWANCQGLSALGPGLLAAWLLAAAAARLVGRPELPPAGERWLLAALGACLLAGLATPYGLRGALLPLRLLARVTPGADNVFSAQIAENVPPLLLERTSPGQLLPLVVVMALVGGSFLLARRPVLLGRAAAVLAFAGLAMMANRNVLLFFWVALPLAVANAAPAVAAWLGRGPTRRTTARLASVVAVAALAVLLVLAARRETSLAAPAPFRVPGESARRIAAQLSGSRSPAGPARVFAADHYGGYLIWALYPRARPYIDTRLVLRTADEYAEFLGLLDHPERWDAFAARQRFDHVLLPTAYPDRYLGLVQHLYGAPGWRLVYTDGSETLFVPAGSPAAGAAIDLGDRAVTDRIMGEIDRRDPGEPEVVAAARLHLGRLQLAVGQPGEALHVLEALPDDDVEATLLRARCRLVRGEIETAAGMVRALLGRHPDLVAAHTLLAIAALTRGQTAEALPHLRRALQIDPYDPEARALLDRLEAASAGRPTD